ncbi:MAG: carbamoyltransferase HypF [Deltaproteobacteria bacterium]|nr:carbamoyltransferase HypF [Deltaproteobacteria bacterium]
MKDDAYVTKRIDVNGIVQGVGFRPFVYQLAHQYQLNGTVANASSGVTILIEGPPLQVNSFITSLEAQSPPLARIVDISVQDEPLHGYRQFQILKSDGKAAMSTLISPDVSICEDCRHELFDPLDRRFQYPFINCTNCGPRYTIIDNIPYDRPHTSMKHFKMCSTCQAEYDDPLNRRFHAQPNACAECGPQVDFYDRQRERVITPDPIALAADLLKEGYVVALKGLGGYHLAVDAENENAVQALRQRKHREEKPFALMSYDLSTIRTFADSSKSEEELLTSFNRPIVLLKKKEPNPIAASVSPRNRYFGVMLPYTPLHYLLLSHGFTALVMTSGNISEEPICIDNEDVFKRLGNIADYFLIHNRNIYLRSDDSIVRESAGQTHFIRRSRGYVPVPIFLKEKLPSILACGAELKNTVCLTQDNKAFVSQHIGDLENLETYNFFKLTIEHLKQILDIEPVLMAYDLHPDYLSTQYAEKQTAIPKIQVQHHHAHIVSCMAENRVSGSVIGLAFDGTGYGSDGHIWGGEVLIADSRRFKRMAHFDYVPMPGSAAAIKEPWRMAISYLWHTYGESFLDLNLPSLKQHERQNIDIVLQMIQKGINSPFTSSLGRLFDAVAALTGLCQKVRYEGQAAMELEMMATDDLEDSYGYEWSTEAGIHLILPQPIICGVVRDIENKISYAVISSRFHATLINLFSDLCGLIRKETGLKDVALSGGVFQNTILLTHLSATLQAKGFSVYTHRLVPSNDGGICLGQAVAAAAMAENIGVARNDT